MSDCQGPVDELLALRSLLRLNQNKPNQTKPSHDQSFLKTKLTKLNQGR